MTLYDVYKNSLEQTNHKFLVHQYSFAKVSDWVTNPENLEVAKI
jgi:hypothetical protein